MPGLLGIIPGDKCVLYNNLYDQYIHQQLPVDTITPNTEFTIHNLANAGIEMVEVPVTDFTEEQFDRVFPSIPRVPILPCSRQPNT
ncbi:hypothetical protein [Deminuibacter soli]|uniref:hypothetical protein n=1 Tax=Deminuibacter soli TaxID=2291815 RepID=UPI001FE57ABC|nr:hypothetical protein [Deminuibacter soli]